jgi:hypothetical protein
MDTAGEDTKVLSMSAVGQFWGDVFRDAPLRIFRSEGSLVYLPKAAAYDEFCRYMDRVRPMGKRFAMHAFVRETEGLCPALLGRDLRKEQGLRAWHISPFGMAESFCKRNRISLVEDFDDFEYLAEEDFGPLP